ncbi:hypothetical protein KGP36_07690 [Patescibacteria group bacterium]|nr:hypothetical protein [Patescibacteria group bacterium]
MATNDSLSMGGNMDSTMMGIARNQMQGMNQAVQQTQKRQAEIQPKMEKMRQEVEHMGDYKPPQAPQLPPKPQLHETSPAQAFGSFASLFGIVASLFTRAPMMNALNASASAMNAIHKNDSDAYHRAMDTWKTETDYALKRSQYDMERYQAIMSNKRASVNDQLALIQAEAAQARDPIMLEQARAGSMQGVFDVLKLREETTNRLSIAKMKFAEQMELSRKNHEYGLQIENMKIKAMEQKNAPALAQLSQKEKLWTDYTQSDEFKNLPPMEKMSRYNNFWDHAFGVQAMKQSEAGGLSNDAKNIAAYQYLTTGHLPPLGIGDAARVDKKEVMNRAAEVASQVGMSPAEIAALPGEYKSNVGSLVQQVRWRDSVARSSMAVENNIQIMREYAAKLDQGQIKALNRAVLQGQLEFNDPNANAYAAAATTVMNEYARVMSGPTSNAQLAEGATDRAQHMLDQSLNPEALDEVGKVMGREMGGQLRATDQVIADIKTSLHDVTQTTGRTTGVGTAKATYHVGQIIEKGGKRYRVVGGDMSDPDVEEAP